MATQTLGTNANTSLTALKYLPGYGSGMSAADIATIAQGIKDDFGNAHKIWPSAFSAAGQLFIPNRGVIQCFPGDYIATDGFGGVILVTKYSIANGPWHVV